MIYVPRRIGQLGNQLFSIAHFASSAIENQFKFVYPCFEYPLEMFPNCNSLDNVKLYRSSDLANKWRARIFKIIRSTCSVSPWHAYHYNEGLPFIDTGCQKFLDGIGRWNICEGFGFRDIENCKKHHETVRGLFSFNAEVETSASQFVAQMRGRSSRVVVGFHIRRGDYRTYRDGEYFYTDESWHSWINQSRRLCRNQGQEFQGILFSDEDVSQLAAIHEDVSMPVSKDMFGDLAVMSKCDLLMGPPSTFSGWASFYGRVPLVRVANAKQPLNFEDFEVVEW